MVTVKSFQTHGKMIFRKQLGLYDRVRRTLENTTENRCRHGSAAPTLKLVTRCRFRDPRLVFDKRPSSATDSYSDLSEPQPTSGIFRRKCAGVVAGGTAGSQSPVLAAGRSTATQTSALLYA